MTKTAEVAALDRFIAELGEHSYLGPWLRDQRDGIVADIASDILPTPLSLGAAWQKAATIVADARESAKVLLDQSRDAAERERARVQKLCDDQREAVAGIIDQHASAAYRALTGRVRR